jgi:hypothetical protein
METDDLSENSRKLRKSMLAFSMVGLVLAYVQPVINKVTVLGTEFIITNFGALPTILGLIILYFLVSFGVNAVDEYTASNRKRREDLIDRIASGKVYTTEEAEEQLGKLKLELKSLHAEFNSLGFNDKTEVTRMIQLKEQEIFKTQKILDFYNTYKMPLFGRINLRRWITNGINVYLPILVGIYTIVLLVFFTKFPLSINEPVSGNPTKVMNQQGESGRLAPPPQDTLNKTPHSK